MRHGIGRLAAGAFLALMAGCASLPQREATAFKTISKADSDAFGTFTTTDLQARSEAAVIQSAGSGITINATNCGLDAAPGSQCVVTMAGAGTPPLTLTEAAPKTRKLIAAVASYGAAMADLAEAKDVAAAQANVDSAEKSIETLFTVTGVAAPAAGFTKAIAAIAKGSMTQARRAALLAAAREADPAIQAAASQLGVIATQIKKNILDTAQIRLNRYKEALGRASALGMNLQRQYDALPAGTAGDSERQRLRLLIEEEQGRRVDAGNALVKTAGDVRLARGLETDFSGLTKAHAALIAALVDEKIGLTEVFDGIGSFLGAVSSAKGS